MINKEEILKELDEAGLSDVEILKEEENYILTKFFYDFEEEELEAAENFAENADDDDEEKEEFEGEDEEYYTSDTQKYLTEIAIDYVGEVLEDIKDDLEIGVQYVGYDMEEDSDSYEFISLFYNNEDSEMDIDDILDEMDI